MSDMVGFWWFAFGVTAGVMGYIVVAEASRFWQWLKFKVWYDYRYAAGYREGLSVGRRVSIYEDSE